MNRTVTLAGFAVIALGSLALQFAGVRWGRPATLAEVLSLIARRRTGRALLLGGWLWLGWHVFVRVHVE